MRVLIACEESQEVCKAFRARGHEAYSADLQKCSGGHPEWHYNGDVIPLINGNCSFITEGGIEVHISGQWDLIIAHPPCTYLTSCGARWLFDNEHQICDREREQKLLEAVQFFKTFIRADCKHIAIENPAPVHYARLPMYNQIIEPYMFGDPWKKRTCLWLKGLPLLKPTNVVKPLACWVHDWPSKTSRVKLRHPTMRAKRSAKERSKTFPGIAKAMAEQWESCESYVRPIYEQISFDEIMRKEV